MERVILHCDCNAFFASVECVLDPALKEVPMAVCGDPQARKGIILAKNELAKHYGIKTAETIWQAKQKCPQLKLVIPHHRLYEEYAARIFELYTRFTDRVEPFGIDEAWLDVSGSQKLFGDGKAIADRIRSAVREEIGVTVSVGVSYNKIFAKLASDYKKPDATTVFARADIREKVYPLPVGDLLFVGKSAQKTLRLLGIHTIGELACAPRTLLQEKFGKFGETLYRYARGEDESPVAVYGAQTPVKSVGNSITFRRDLCGEEDIRIGLRALADKVASRLRKHGVLCAAVSVVIRDAAFHTITRQTHLRTPTDLSAELFAAAYALTRASWNFGKAIRMLGITGTKLISAGDAPRQLSLLEQGQEKREKTGKKEDAMDAIRARFGKDAIAFGVLLHRDTLF